jgi:hypothetical protein
VPLSGAPGIELENGLKSATFLKKSSKKLLLLSAGMLSDPMTQNNKVFLLLFVHKK